MARIYNTNEVKIAGRLGDDPKITELDNGNAVGNFSMANTRNFRDSSGEWQKETDWYDVTVWGKERNEELAAFTKGDQLIVFGSLRVDKWTNDEGQNRRRVKINAYDFNRLDYNKPLDDDYNRLDSTDDDW